MTKRLLIPTTEVRRLYEFLGKCSLETRHSILKDFDRADSKRDILVKIVNRSAKHFKSFSNIDEEFLRNDHKRKELPVDARTKEKKRTNDIVKLIQNMSNGKGANYKIRYIEREIDPRRSTNAEYDFGERASHSGTGGIDFIGWDETNKKPFIGEVKTPTDKEAFYALIQVLMYFVEVSTPLQIERCNKHLLFKRKLKVNQEFSLGIVLTDFHKRSAKYQSTLVRAKSLASYVCNGIDQIHSIQFLDFADPYNEFTAL